jgi:6-phosphofructokinase 1
VARAIGARDFDRAFRLRDPYFRVNYLMTQSLQVRHVNLDTTSRPSLKVGLINVGAPAGGMNTANRAIVHYCLSQGHEVLGIFNGFRGLQQDEVRPLRWADVDAWVNKGGSEIGTNRSLPDEDLGQVACQMQRYELDAMILVGGFEAFHALLQLARARDTYPAFGIPMICLPATVSNNVPGTEFSVGSDTALNSIMHMCDSIKQSASSSRKRLFVVDVQGGYCGYLATLSCLISGGTYSYIHEEGVRLEDLLRESRHLKSRFAEDKRQGRIIVRNEFCSNTYSAEVMSSIFEEEAEGLFDSRWVTLGHVVQGGRPSPLDRVRATRLAVMAVNYIEAFLCPDMLHDQALRQFEAVRDRELARAAASHGSLPSSSAAGLETKVHALLAHSRHLAAAVIGIHGPEVEFNSAAELAEFNTDMKLRIPKQQWWLPLRRLNRVLAKYKD